MVSIPESTSVSIDTIRGFFNAYLLHKYFVDFIVNLNAAELVDYNWVYQTNVENLYENLLKLQDALNFNIQKLHLLVSAHSMAIAWLFKYMLILLSQLNTTCDACTSNSTNSAIVNATLIDAMEKCKSPIYEVINTIANHSEKLFITVNTWQDAISVSMNDNSVTSVTNINQDINDVYLCNIPTPEIKI